MTEPELNGQNTDMDTEEILPAEEEEIGAGQGAQPGTLYIVATPIGNSRDMSPRGKAILSTVDIIAAEDTRRSMILLGKLGIRNRLVSNHKFNEHGKADSFVAMLLEGKSVAVITDAGTPCISDPGNELVQAAVENGIRVISVPGCCAAVTALAISGFDLRNFFFYGFFPRENADRRRLLDDLRHNGMTRTYVFYESPRRIMEVVDTLAELPCRLCVCNDLTKLYETAFRGTPAEVREKLLAKGNYEKGEFVVVAELCPEAIVTEVERLFSPEAHLADVLVRTGCDMKAAMDAVLHSEGNTYTKKELYAAGLRLKKLFAKEETEEE